MVNFTSNGMIDMLPAIMELQDLPSVLQNFTRLDCDPQRDCMLAAKCVGEELANDDLSASTSFALVNFARACAPEPLTNISYEQILGWNSFLVVNQRISVLNLTDQVNQGCHREFCQNLDWEGDPDLSGPGVLAAYMIQAILSSGFCLFHLSLGELPSLFRSALPHVNRCFDVFWITSLYFGFAISAATYTLNLFPDHLHAVPRYVASFSFLGTVFSFSATAALAPWCTRKGTREPLGGGGVLGGFFAIGTFAVFCSVNSYAKSFQASSPSTSPFETYCLAVLEGYESFKIFLIFTLSCMVAAWVAWLVTLVAIYFVKPVSKLIPLIPLAKITVSALAFCCFTLMWASLALFIRLRLESGELSDKGRDANMRWGFGQIVAVVGWLPMAVEIGSVAKGVVLRRFRGWGRRGDREHVGSAVADGDNNTTASETQEENVKSNRVIKPKKVKTW